MKSGMTINYWLGDDGSLQNAMDGSAAMRALLPQEPENNENYWTRLIDVQSDVATISVHGSLVSKDSELNAMFGRTSYNEIRNAIAETISNEDVNSILLDISSGGGDAEGVAELGMFIRAASLHKPIHSYISGKGFSAAYWIAASTLSISGMEMSEAGSIGVIALIQTVEKMLEDEGVSIHVLRFGKVKALGNQYEELTDEAKAVLQSKIDKMGGFFLKAMSEFRGLSVASAETWADGKTFFMQEAIEVGLADKIATFDAVFDSLLNNGNNTTNVSVSYNEDVDMGKLVLTEAAIAAKATGASDADVEALMVEETKADPVVAAAVDGKADPVVEGELEVAAESELMTYLKDEVKTLREDNAKLSAKLSIAEEGFGEAQANEQALKKIAGTFINQLSIALGQKAPAGIEGLDTGNVLAQYKSVRKAYTAAFKVGGVAEVEDGVAEEQAGDTLSPYEQAALNANKF